LQRSGEKSRRSGWIFEISFRQTKSCGFQVWTKVSIVFGGNVAIRKFQKRTKKNYMVEFFSIILDASRVLSLRNSSSLGLGLRHSSCLGLGLRNSSYLGLGLHNCSCLGLGLRNS